MGSGHPSTALRLRVLPTALWVHRAALAGSPLLPPAGRDAEEKETLRFDEISVILLKVVGRKMVFLLFAEKCAKARIVFIGPPVKQFVTWTLKIWLNKLSRTPMLVSSYMF